MRAFLLVIFVDLVKTPAAATPDVTGHANWHLMDHELCGESLSADRIIGGTVAGLGQYPWMARLGYLKTLSAFNRRITYKCGGSLISNVYILTAAHCVTGLSAGEFLVVIRLGEFDEKTEVDCQGDVCAPPVQDRRPQQTIHHEGYSDAEMSHDIALVRLDKPANLNMFVNTICLPHGPLLFKSYVGEAMEVAGWGVTTVTENLKTSPMLLHVRVPIVNSSRCRNPLAEHLISGQLCAGGQIGFDSCAGDSGGPLMAPEAVDGPPRYYQIGIVSFGTVNCGGDKPAVYTKIAHYLLWILDKMEP